MSEKLSVEARAVMDLTSRENATYTDVLAAVVRMEAAAEERGRLSQEDLLREVRRWIADFPWSTRAGQDLPWMLNRIDAALAPCDSGTCGADEDGLHREARKDRK